MTQTVPEKKSKCLCRFNDKEKEPYTWIRESNQNKAYYMMYKKCFEIGLGGEGDIKANIETEYCK